jgi:hypothetical protein
MKKFTVMYLAQTAEQLIRINNVASTNDMQNISNPFEGNLVYVKSENCFTNIMVQNG